MWKYRQKIRLDRLSSEVSIVGTASDGPLQQQEELLRLPPVVVSNQRESVRNRVFSHRRRPRLEVLRPPVFNGGRVRSML